MPLLSVRDLEVRFVTRRATIHAVNGISFDLEPGETLGIVGESGCGKSASSLAMVGLLPRAGRVTGGQVELEGRDLLTLSPSQLRRVRGGQVAMIFQDPYSSLNPVLTIGRQLVEVLRAHLAMGRRDAETEATRLLERVGIGGPARRLRAYPHQLSGGMRQRVMIAMAISCRPKVLIADEPTTALDVTIQAQILDLLGTLVAQERMALILITHDLAVVAGVCQRTGVMYAGRLVETGPTPELFARPRHPYTLGLLRSIPRLDAARPRRLDPIGGAPPDLRQLPTGCAFAPRCAYASQACREREPGLEPAGGSGHLVACHNPVPDADLVAAGLRPDTDG
ncbi:MAG: ABC transporter ATP-binding protein [Egibacteraceae bacterium]